MFQSSDNFCYHKNRDRHNWTWIIIQLIIVWCCFQKTKSAILTNRFPRTNLTMTTSVVCVCFFFFYFCKGTKTCTCTLSRVTLFTFLVIQTNTTVLTLDLEDNWIEGTGAAYIADMLKENCYISELVSDFTKYKNFFSVF